MNLLAMEMIKKKRNGHALDEQEIKDFILGYARGQIPDYQMSALLMAIYFRGMSEAETLCLTKAMLESGEIVDFSNVPEFKVDKHSTGGVGDKTSMILGPIVAACGLKVPMISGRGLGHTGGTLDKLESIPGFNTQLSLQKFKELVAKIGICFIGQTSEICPADKRIYALRDVTATVESLPLICGSIMSKKLAEGIDGLVLDVKFGNGAFMKTLEQAETLAKALAAIGRGYGKKVSCLLTDMNQPLGRFSGNSLEIQECLEIMEGKKHLNQQGRDLYADVRELSIALSAQMLHLGGAARSLDAAISMAQESLQSGTALRKFQEICKAQGGDLAKIPRAQKSVNILAEQAGFLSGMQTENLGVAGIMIKAGRATTTDVLDHTAGIEYHCKIGDEVRIGQVIMTLHGNDLSLLESALPLAQASVTISLQKPPVPTLISKILS